MKQTLTGTHSDSATTSAPRTTKPYRPFNPEHGLRFGKPLDVDIADTEDKDLRPLYYGELVERLIRKMHARMEYDKTRYKPEHRFSWANLSRALNIPYRTIVSWFIARDNAISIRDLDRVLWASKLSILDLIEPIEVISHIRSMTYQERISLRNSFTKCLDRLDAMEYSTNAANPQTPNAEEDAE